MKQITLLLLLLQVGLLYAVDPSSILKQADAWRAPGETFEMSMSISSYVSNTRTQSLKLKGYIKNGEKSMVSFFYPANWKGKKILMIKNDMWMLFPNTRNPIRVTPAQRLMGQVANGDVARVNFSLDYEAKLLQTEVVNKKSCYKLQLIAQESGFTYYKILYWVTKDSFIPVKAVFYARSGRKLKTAYYSKVKKFGVHRYLYRTTIYDAVQTDKYTIMEYTDFEKKPVPDRYFNISYLRRM